MRVSDLLKGPNRDRLKVYGPALMLSGLVFLLLFQLVEPAPPERLILASGMPGGAYHRFALEYRGLLAREGVELEVRETSGSVENLRLLREAAVDVAFVQTGVADSTSQAGLVSLASLYYEPLWVFYRGLESLERLPELSGSTVAVGPEGSGTRVLALTLLRENGLDRPPTRLSDLGGPRAAQALREGAVDAAVFVASPRAPVVAEVLADPGIELLNFSRVDAYLSRYRYLSSVVLPEGAIDFQRNIPGRPVTLLAPAATLVVRTDFHPALTDLMLQAAFQLHAQGGFFERPGQFPSADHLDFPLIEDARRYFERGPSFLRRYLPFWAAVFVERSALFLLPLVTLLVPLFRIAVPTYRWKVRSRIYRWYRDLSAVELSVDAGTGQSRVALEELDRIEQEAAKVEVPLSYTDELYNLRLHIQLVRDKINKRHGRPEPVD